MFKYIPYLLITMVVMLVQIFIIDQLSIAMWLRPMIFPLVVVLLPMEWRMIWVILITLAVSVVMDLSLGGAGLYTATLLPIALLRPTILFITTGRSVEPGDQSPLLSRIGIGHTMAFLAAMFFIHHLMFFALETLSLTNVLQLIMTIIFSTLLSTILAWPVVRIYNSKVVA